MEATKQQATEFCNEKQGGGFSRKKQKNICIQDFTRKELEAKVQQLEAHNKQLKNLLAKSQGIVEVLDQTKYAKKKPRPFDFSKHSKRHVLLKFCYLGWDCQGFAVQEDTQQTIEAQLFRALLKIRLIESRETSNYHRCGRTDKGVSAFDQVISITLRSKLKTGIGVISHGTGEEGSDAEEINYVQLLNKVLPHDIRMLAWCPVEAGFSARFNCNKRKYKYFFPRGNLDIKLMNEGAQYLVGSHDYRNFCKMDVGNGVVNYCRCILSISISPLCCDMKNARSSKDYEEKIKNSKADAENLVDISSSHEIGEVNEKLSIENCKCTYNTSNELVQTSQNPEGYDMCVANIEGQAFLWHQVRAIMAILILIGEKKEEPEVVKELLNVEKYPRKPQYCLASDIPLNLYETSFEEVNWRYDSDSLHRVISQLQGLWTQESVKSTMIRRMLWDLESRHVCMQKSKEETSEERPARILDQSLNLTPGARTKIYRPLLSRPTCESLETRVEHYVKRQRLDPDILHRSSTANPQ